MLGVGAWYWADAFRGVSFIAPHRRHRAAPDPVPGLGVPVVSATSNGVNLTDGMDGLASGSTVLVVSAYVVIGFWQFRHLCGAPADTSGCYQFPAGESPRTWPSWPRP